MSWITILAMLLFGMSALMAFECGDKKTWRKIFWRLTFVVSTLLLCIYPCDDLRNAIGTVLAILLTLGYGGLCAAMFYGVLLLISWIFQLEMDEIYHFLLGDK